MIDFFLFLDSIDQFVDLLTNNIDSREELESEMKMSQTCYLLRCIKMAVKCDSLYVYNAQHLNKVKSAAVCNVENETM